MKYKLINNGKQKTFAIILDNGEEVIEKISAFAKQQKLSASQFTAIRAFSETTVGFFDFSIKDYRKTFLRANGSAGTNGDITIYNDEYKIHAHVILGKEDSTAHGGHVMKAIVHPILEIILNEFPFNLERQMDKKSGIPLIKM